MKKNLTLLFAAFISFFVVAEQNDISSNGMNEDLKTLHSVSSNLQDDLESEFFADWEDILMPSAFTMDCCEKISDLIVPFRGFEPGIGDYLISNNGSGLRHYGQVFTGRTPTEAFSVIVYMRKLYENAVKDLHVEIHNVGWMNFPSSFIAASEAVSTSEIPLDGKIHAVKFNFSEPVNLPADFVVTVYLPEYETKSAITAIASSRKTCYNPGEEGYIICSTDGIDWTPITEAYNELYYPPFCFDLAVFVNLKEDDDPDDPEPVSLNLQDENTYSIYPNPATDIIFIENASGSLVKVIDTCGKTVTEKNIQSSKESIEVGHLIPGIYFIEITGKLDKCTTKLLKK